MNHAKPKQAKTKKPRASLPFTPIKSANSASNFLAVTTIALLDLTAVAISLLMAYLTRNYLLVLIFPAYFAGELLNQTFELLWWYPLAFIFCLAYENLYQKRLPFWIEVKCILKAATLTLFLSVVLLYLVQMGEEVSRTFILLTWGFSILTIPLVRYYGKHQLHKRGLWNRPVLLLGDAYTIPLVYKALNREKTMGYTVRGYLSSPDEYVEQAKNGTYPSNMNSNLSSLGVQDEAESIIAETNIRDIIIAEPRLPSADLVKLTNRLQPLVNNIILVPDLFGISLSGIEAAYFFEEQAVFLHIKNRLKSKLNRFIKRLFDLTVGTALSLLSLPFILIIGFAVKLDSPGPAFYISTRIGQAGKHFRCYKFRTMYLNTDTILRNYLNSNEQARYEWERYNKLITEDPRVTRIGRVLRQFSLDELPQFINIMRGEMSLVGPRPYLPREKDQMASYMYDILISKPGLTGLWQVSGRNKLSFESRLKLDAWYIKNWSLWLDMVLLLKTLRVVMKSDGAY